jgi:hypothetical protein
MRSKMHLTSGLDFLVGDGPVYEIRGPGGEARFATNLPPGEGWAELSMLT